MACLVAGLLTVAAGRLAAANPIPPLLNDPMDVSGDFRDFSNLYYLADRLADFDPATGTGKITYQRSQYFTRQAFNNMLAVIKPVAPNEFPENEYAANPTLPFSIEFVSPRTLRIRLASGPQYHKHYRGADAGRRSAAGPFLEIRRVEGGHRYTSDFGSVTIFENPWHIEFRDAAGPAADQNRS